MLLNSFKICKPNTNSVAFENGMNGQTTIFSKYLKTEKDFRNSEITIKYTWTLYSHHCQVFGSFTIVVSVGLITDAVGRKGTQHQLTASVTFTERGGNTSN